MVSHTITHGTIIIVRAHPHTVITKPVNRPTHRPNISTVRPNIIKNIRTENNSRIYVKPNRNINIKTNKSNVKINKGKPVNTRKPK
mgnify:CR=1 FL=1